MKRIYLIDCPGVVPPNNNDSQEDILLRGVVRVENVENPEQYIATVLKRTKNRHVERTYDIRGFDNATEFLELLARKSGRLLKGGEADVDGVAKMVLNDFLRGKIPWFTPPPVVEGQESKGITGRKGVLGEMGKVRRPEDHPSSHAEEPDDGTPARNSGDEENQINRSAEEEDESVVVSDEDLKLIGDDSDPLIADGSVIHEGPSMDKDNEEPEEQEANIEAGTKLLEEPLSRPAKRRKKR